MNSIVSINKEEDISKITKETKYINIPIDIVNNNINNYFLCKIESFGEKNLTQDEIERFHLSTLELSYEEAVREYEDRANTSLGKLIANRELPILHRAKEIIERRISNPPLQVCRALSGGKGDAYVSGS